MGALDLFPMPLDAEYSYARKSTFKRGVHEGLDIFAPLGTPVLAVFDGEARGVLDEGKGGNVVYLEQPGPFGRRAFYAHLDSLEPPLATETVQASAGDVLGYVGNTGNAKGKDPHLHFGLTNPNQKSFADPFDPIEAVDPKRGGTSRDPNDPPDPAPVFNVDVDSGAVEFTPGAKAFLGILVLGALWFLFGDKPKRRRS